jgi:DNA-binding NtrC family response regulator
MTGSPELETAMRAANLPIAGYLLKPLDYDAAAAAIERLAADHRHRRELHALSQQVVHLLGSHLASADPADPLAGKLEQLGRQLAAAAQRNPREGTAGSGAPPWRDAIAETIAVLEKTKHSFRSKELGELRKRLQQLVLQKHPQL